MRPISNSNLGLKTSIYYKEIQFIVRIEFMYSSYSGFQLNIYKHNSP